MSQRFPLQDWKIPFSGGQIRSESPASFIQLVFKLLFLNSTFVFSVFEQ